MIVHRIAKIALILVAGFLAHACATVGMADGRRSILIDEDLELRERLSIRHVQNPAPFRYHPLESCRLHIEGAPSRTLGTIYDRTILTDEVRISIRQVQDRYVASVVDGRGEASTLTLTGLGQRSDYNLVGMLSQDGRLSMGDTPQSFERLADGRDVPLDPNRLFRRYQLVFPEFERPTSNPGEVVGYIRNLDNRPWAALRYQGVVGQIAQPHAVIDVIQFTSKGEEVMMGYIIIDLASMLPRNVTIWDQTRFHVSMHSPCR